MPWPPMACQGGCPPCRPCPRRFYSRARPPSPPRLPPSLRRGRRPCPPGPGRRCVASLIAEGREEGRAGEGQARRRPRGDRQADERGAGEEEAAAADARRDPVQGGPEVLRADGPEGQDGAPPRRPEGRAARR